MPGDPAPPMLLVARLFMHLWSTYVPVTLMVHHLMVPTPNLLYDPNGSTPMVPLVSSLWSLWSPSLWSLRSPFNGSFRLTPCRPPLPRPPVSSTPWSPVLFCLLAWFPVIPPGLPSCQLPWLRRMGGVGGNGVPAAGTQVGASILPVDLKFDGAKLI